MHLVGPGRLVSGLLLSGLRLSFFSDTCTCPPAVTICSDPLWHGSSASLARAGHTLREAEQLLVDRSTCSALQGQLEAKVVVYTDPAPDAHVQLANQYHSNHSNHSLLFSAPLVWPLLHALVLSPLLFCSITQYVHRGSGSKAKQQSYEQKFDGCQ